MIVVTILIFILIFGLIVFIHELGHFLMAKRVGIQVEEFAFGFPPRIFAWKKGETVYAINALPLGGYVRMRGEDSEDTDPRAFGQKSALQRGLVIVAGVTMNVVLAWIVLTFILVLPASLKGGDNVLIADVVAGSPAAGAHFQAGDILLKINETTIKKPQELADFTSSHKGQTVNVTVRHQGQEQTKSVTLGSTSTPLGVSVSNFSLADVASQPAWKAPITAIQEIWFVIKGNVMFIGSLIGGLLGLAPKVSTEAVSGPIGIYGLVAQFAALGWVYLLFILAQLSLAVAVFNILPIPALDGGRLLFIVINRIFNRKLVPQRIEAIAHTIGFALLIGLFLLITVNDIVRLRK